jgi:caffeoyl-CoA O-methyltransferase
VEPLLPRAVDGYLDDLVTAQLYDPVLVDLERRAEALDLPTRGRAVGRHLEVVLQLAGARRVLELGAGFGETTYWLARAVGEDGEVVAVIDDPEDAAVAESMLRRAGLFERVTIVIAEPRGALAGIAGKVDAVVGAVDAGDGPALDAGDPGDDPALDAGDPGDDATLDAGDPAAQLWVDAADRVEVGGVLALLDVLRAGQVARLPGAPVPSEVDRVVAISREVVNDPRFDSTITPLRDGIQLAHRRR